jgi:hypothetical protein
MINSFTQRFLFILFVLFRPKFLDDDKYSMSFNQTFNKKNGLAFQDFEFIFYSNHYYLKQDANIDDLALKLNSLENALRGNENKKRGFYVRCVRD